MSNDRMSIGHLSRRSGVNVETIRYYERIGLLPPAPRTAGGHRLYAGSHWRRLAFVRRARELGFSLGEVRTLLSLVDGGYTCGEVQVLALHHLERVREKIRDLQRLERTLRDTAEQCEGGAAPACPVIDVLFGHDSRTAG